MAPESEAQGTGESPLGAGAAVESAGHGTRERARRSRLGFGEVVGHSTRERRGDSDATRRAKERRRSTAPGREDSGKAEGHSTRNRDVWTRREAVRDLRGVSEAAGHRYQRDSWSARVHERSRGCKGTSTRCETGSRRK